MPSSLSVVRGSDPLWFSFPNNHFIAVLTVLSSERLRLALHSHSVAVPRKKSKHVSIVLSCIENDIARLSSMTDADVFSLVDCCDCTSLNVSRCIAENIYFDKVYGVDFMNRIRAPKLIASVDDLSYNTEFAPWLTANAEDSVVHKLDRLRSDCLRSAVEKIHPSSVSVTVGRRKIRYARALFRFVRDYTFHLSILNEQAFFAEIFSVNPYVDIEDGDRLDLIVKVLTHVFSTEIIQPFFQGSSTSSGKLDFAIIATSSN